MFSEGLQLLVACALMFGPGLAVLLVGCGVRERLWWAGLSAPLTMGLIVVTGVLTALLGIKFSIVTFAVFTAVLTGAAVAVRRLIHRSGDAPTLKVESVGRAGQISRLLGLLIAVAGVGRGLLVWHHGLGQWRVPTQEHDPVTHTVLTAFIHLTGKAAAWQVLPNDIVGDTSIQFYPPGFSSMAALITDVVGDPTTSGNLVTVVSSAVVLPLSVAAFVAAVLRQSGLGRGWIELAGGIAAFVAVELYRPAIAFAHDGGALPNAFALTLVPGIVAVLLVVRKRQWLGAAAAGLAAAGAVAVHPSAAASAGLTLIAAWVGLAFSKSGRTRFVQSLLPMMLAGVVGAVATIPVLIGLSGLGEVGSSPADIASATLGNTIDTVLRLPYLGYFDRSGTLDQVGLTVMALGGVLAVLVFRRGWPLLTAWLFWMVVSISFHLSPSSGFGAQIGRFFYRSATRIDSHIYLFIPCMVGCLFVLTAVGLTELPVKEALARFRPLAAVGLAAISVGVVALTVFPDYNFQNVRALKERYATPEFIRYDAADGAAADWLHEHVAPGETILNSANDGSTMAYTKYALPILNIVPDGHSPLTERVSLLKSFNTYPDNPRTRETLRRLNVRWVYSDSRAPLIGTDAHHWNGGGIYQLAPGLQNVAGLPGLEPVFNQGSVTLYRLDLEQLEEHHT
jgi:hypothetical protein